MGELSWRDLQGSSEPEGMSRADWVGLAILVATLFLGVAALLPVRDLLASPAELAARYPRSPAWLNRCDTACEANVNTAFLDAQRHCGALVQLSADDNRTDLFAWRLAIDDRASALGCHGFPQPLAAIRSGVQAAVAANLQQGESIRKEREAQMQGLAAQELQRFEASLADGGLGAYVTRISRDPADPDLLILTVGPEWFAVPQGRQEQIADVLRQKWAVIHVPGQPTLAEILLVDSGGLLVIPGS